MFNTGSRLTERFVAQATEIDDDTIAFYREHPEELDLIINKEEVRLGFFRILFLIGLAVALGARAAAHFFPEALGPFMTNVVLDLIFEMGNAILGGVLTAFFLEYLEARQYQENVRFREEVKRRIKELENEAPPA
ncbi:MAG: hypothetical protein AAFU54_27460 [Chloroflexota bacterium]